MKIKRRQELGLGIQSRRMYGDKMPKLTIELVPKTGIEKKEFR